MADRRKDVSPALTEVRTVHSRAKSAIERIERERGWALQGDDFERSYYTIDPDTDAILRDLKHVVAKLDRWKRG